MEKPIYSVDEIKELISCVKQQSVEKLKLKQGEFSLEIIGATCSNSVLEAPATQVAEPLPTKVIEAVSEEINGTAVVSPIVGTFYQSPNPEKPAFVTVGSVISKGDVLFIIESMKLMNEVTSEVSGTVTQIHVDNGQVVEYGQIILTVK